jgi:hypothetical protein
MNKSIAVATGLIVLVGIVVAESKEPKSPARTAQARTAQARTAQARSTPTATTPVSTTQAAAQQIRFKHLTVDRKARTLTLEAEIVQAEYMLEFLLCKAGTKEYESVMSTKAKPWQVHAGLLMLGLWPGKPGDYVGEKYIPPRGAALNITLRWRDKTGKTHTADAADWLKLSGKGKKKTKPKQWIFVGSETLPDGRYLADQNGGIIAVANLPAAVIDVPIESIQAIKSREFVVDVKAIPPAGTKVTVIITPCRDAESAPDARSILDIDSRGAMRMDGRKIAWGKLRPWAEKFTEAHTRGMVVIRSDGRAMRCWAQRAQMELKLGGVYEFQLQTSPLAGPLLPRTDAQANFFLNQWRERFARPQEQIYDPAQQIIKTLTEINRQRAELKRLDALLAEYDKSLRAEQEKYRKRDDSKETPQRTSPNPTKP